ncbi:MAG TPA: SDR family NAD(P)-dependent oxidoreductase, partial [Acidimicrobiales bacterium]|nr:SDR family NAD(P)-dependent oxidoreductase [Acidimicrobiales bacterium]
MEIRGKVAVVTGAASGIGRALCVAFAEQGAKAVVAADVDSEGAEAVAAEISSGGVGALGVATDVSVEADVQALVRRTEEAFGPIDVFCSNAGIIVVGGVEASDEAWDRIWRINVMSHVYAARAVLPGMLERGSGYLVHTASAAGLLTQLGSAPYSVTKHAVVALAEWLSITHGDAGVRVSCLCPQAVATNLG